METVIPAIRLTSGASMPCLGFGTGTAWFKGCKGEQQLTTCLHSALDLGLLHIDEAEMYENEISTGAALASWLAKGAQTREDVFITSKILVGIEGGIEARCRQTLAALGVEHLDLYLLHAPFNHDGTPFERAGELLSLEQVWAEMEGLVELGLVKDIGVSNWRIQDLQQIATAKIPASVNQIENHPYLQQPELLQYCKGAGIVVTSYAPLAPLTKKTDGPVSPKIEQLAQQYGRTAAQILIRWNLQGGKGVITTSTRPEGIGQLLPGLFDFELTAEEMGAIDTMGASTPHRAYWTSCPMDSVV